MNLSSTYFALALALVLTSPPHHDGHPIPFSLPLPLPLFLLKCIHPRYLTRKGFSIPIRTTNTSSQRSTLNGQRNVFAPPFPPFPRGPDAFRLIYLDISPLPLCTHRAFYLPTRLPASTYVHLYLPTYLSTLVQSSLPAAFFSPPSRPSQFLEFLNSSRAQLAITCFCFFAFCDFRSCFSIFCRFSSFVCRLSFVVNALAARAGGGVTRPFRSSAAVRFPSSRFLPILSRATPHTTPVCHRTHFCAPRLATLR